MNGRRRPTRHDHLWLVLSIALMGCGIADDDDHGGTTPTRTDGNGESSVTEASDATSGADASETTSGSGAESASGAEGGGVCSDDDECRTAEDCMPGQLCSGCSCCDPGEEGGINLECGEQPPPGGQYCVDEPGTMFICVPPQVCCGSKEQCYDPERDPTFCD
jgi:hypothetical protein